MAAEISPGLRLSDKRRLDQGTTYDARAWNGFANFVLSFTVSRRTREIAVRILSKLRW